MTDIAVSCSDLTKTYHGNTVALHKLDLKVGQGEILAILGPSGCGKTTTLRLIAGFERPTHGTVRLQGKTVANSHVFVPPEKREVGMIFQEYALFPHMTVHDNVAFGLAKKSMDEKYITSMLRLVGITHLAERHPHELSGGERQRVALARALAPKPVLLLFDEPFSNLDADRRNRMREEVRAILKTTGSTAVFVTHDQEEALFMGDCVAVLKEGKLEQMGTPEEIFLNPATRFVAEFMGSTDFLPGEVTPEGIMTEIGLLPQKVDFPLRTKVEVAFRADDVTFALNKEGKSMVLARFFKGAYNVYRLRLPSGYLIHAMQTHTRNIPPGTPIDVIADPGHELACFCRGKRG